MPPERRRSPVPDPKDWGVDEWAVALIVAAGIVWGIRHIDQVLGFLAARLQQAGIVLPPGRGVIDVPRLGGLDAVRLLVITGFVVAAVGVAMIAGRRRSGEQNG